MVSTTILTPKHGCIITLQKCPNIKSAVSMPHKKDITMNIKTNFIQAKKTTLGLNRFNGNGSPVCTLLWFQYNSRWCYQSSCRCTSRCNVCEECWRLDSSESSSLPSVSVLVPSIDPILPLVSSVSPVLSVDKSDLFGLAQQASKIKIHAYVEIFEDYVNHF